jgi:DNA-binding GntR family transcriptional regulator
MKGFGRGLNMDAANDLHESLADELSGALDLKERSDSLVGRIANDIARAISDGTLAPGADLNSVELAARFGTSRTPVREALMLLEKEGLVEIPPRRRPRVAKISLDEAEELYQIRAVLNGLMITLFVRNATADLIEEMERLHDRVQSSGRSNPEAFQEDRRRLHNYWLDNCGNQSLRNLLSTWKMRMSVGRLVHYEPEDVERSLSDHARLVIACRDRDETLAAALMRSMTLSGLAAIKRQHQPRT